MKRAGPILPTLLLAQEAAEGVVSNGKVVTGQGWGHQEQSPAAQSHSPPSLATKQEKEKEKKQEQ